MSQPVHRKSNEDLDLHLELTTQCYLKCHACPRTIHRKDLSITEMSLEAVSSLVRNDYKYRYVHLCGNHGDPIYHSDFVSVIELLKKKLKGHPPLFIYTNGFGRNKSFWEEVAEVLTSNDTIIFGIDGLDGTSAVLPTKLKMGKYL
jgi:molybdenum cofactor biosynthesis enzyme MoaA